QKSPVVNPRNLSLLAFSLARLLRIIIDYTFDAVALPDNRSRFVRNRVGNREQPRPRNVPKAGVQGRSVLI
ncbi:MAG: hypothetical protein ACOVQM_01670, partial [Pirellula sp.]